MVQFWQKKFGMAGTNKPKLDQNLKPSKPGTLTYGFTKSPEFIEAYRFKLLKSLMKLRKMSQSYHFVMNETGIKSPNPPGSAFFPSRRLPLKKYQIIYIY